MRDIVVTPRLTIPAGELDMSFARSGGAGGQNVNKVSRKVDLRWNSATSAALTPTIVMEGGYAVDALGDNVASFLAGF